MVSSSFEPKGRVIISSSGKGRDASQQKYGALQLASAWRIENSRRSKRVDGGTQCMEEELDVLRKKGALNLRDVAANVMTAAAAAERPTSIHRDCGRVKRRPLPEKSRVWYLSLIHI